ncbi:MAG: YihY/virulence factor BrkB family protein, partial [Ignavibacteriaceae bacterium]
VNSSRPVKNDTSFRPRNKFRDSIRLARWYARKDSIKAIKDSIKVAQDSLNMVWKIKPKPGSSIFKGLIKERIKSLGLIIGTGFLLLVSLIISAVISFLSNFIADQFVSIPIFFLDLIDIIVSLTIISVLFGMIFKGLPDAHLEWRHVWVGALVTGGLFVVGKYLIGLYIGQSSLSSTYGTAGALVVLLLWVYYSSQILFLGAEFTQVYSEKYGEGIKPRKHFMKYNDESLPIEAPDKIIKEEITQTKNQNEI